jgi:hypothetical protein
MPLHIGDTYHEIRGPYGLVLLRPIREPDCTFLLLSEVHSPEHWNPCDVPHCANVHSDFIKSLDKLARHHPVEFYVEDFFDSMGEMTVPDPHQLAITRRHVSKLQQVTHTKTKFKHNMDIHLGSHTMEISRLHKECFLPYTKANCVYPHIGWNYADARKQQTLSYSSIPSYTSLYSEMIRIFDQYHNGSKRFPDSDKLLNYNDEDKSWEFHYEDGITVELLTRLGVKMRELLTDHLDTQGISFPDDILLHYLEMLRNIITLPPEEYMNLLLNEPHHNVVFEQYRSLPEELREVFTIESFVQHQQHYKDKYPDHEEANDDIVQLLTLLIEFYEHMDDPSVAGRRKEISDEMMRMHFPDEEFEYFENVFMYFTSITLDMYFMLRVYNRKKRSKLVVGYFGGAHVNAIANYLVHVVKTHREEYRTEGEGRVVIEPDIHVLPVSGKTRKRGKRKIKSLRKV